MTSLLQRFRNIWTLEMRTPPTRDSWSHAVAELGTNPPDAVKDGAAHPGERRVSYDSLIELRNLLQTFAHPARTTVVLVLDSRTSVHLPTLLRREAYAFRLILTTASGELLSTHSAGDLALQGRAWGWCAVLYERDQQRALEFARTTTEQDEHLLVLRPKRVNP